MDRELDKSFLRNRSIRRVGITATAIALIAVFFILGPSIFRKKISRSKIRTARVTTGRVENVIDANGIVTPRNEHVISSPVDARVLKLLKKPGDTLVPGDSLLELDLNQTVLELETLQRQIDLQKNQKNQVRLNLNKEIATLKYQKELKELELITTRNEAARSRDLFEGHCISKENLERSQMEVNKVQVEIRQLNDSIISAQKIADARLEGLGLELLILEKQQEETERQMELATAKSHRAGVLTWIIDQEGATVRKGDVIARISDLETFKVEATVSDVHASQIYPNQQVRVRYNNTSLAGRISSVRPTINNGAITLDIELNDPDNKILRSNLRVDVQIITAYRDQALRINRGPGLSGNCKLDVFVIKDDEAIRTNVEFGLSNFDFIEVKSGLPAGDEVIISQMDEYRHLRKISIKQ